MATRKAPPHDNINRGVKEPSPAGTLTFIGLRALDPILQYQLLVPRGWGSALLSKMGISTIAPGVAAATGFAMVDNLGLPLPQLLLLTMAIGSAVKQIYWVVSLSKEALHVDAALTVATFTTFVHSANALLLLAAATSSTKAVALAGTTTPYAYLLGPAIFALGIVLETLSEYQRRNFKDDPKNQGKVMRSGLWSWARHINYGGHTLWSGASALTASGIVAGLAVGGFFAWNFVNSVVPLLDDYCAGRYGEQWKTFRKDVRWMLLPGIY